FTDSEDFPVINNTGNANTLHQTTKGCSAPDCNSAFIVKINSTATNPIIWSSYFGDTGDCGGNAIRLDDNGNVYFVGSGTDLPVDGSGTYMETSGSGFVQEFTNDGVPIWGTTIGTSSTSKANVRSVEVSSGTVYVAGDISASDLPPTPLNSWGGTSDGFAISFDGSSHGVNWSRFLGGLWDDAANDLVFVSPNIYVTGATQSDPTLTFPGPDLGGTLDYQQGHADAASQYRDIFISRSTASSGALNYGTYYGGGGYDVGKSICAGTDGTNTLIYITGYTDCSNFPFPSSNLANAYDDEALNGLGNDQPFIIMLDQNLSNKWVTLFGKGTGDEYGTGVSAYSNQKLYITGYSFGNEFPFDDGQSVPFDAPDPYYFDAIQITNGYTTRFNMYSVLTGIVEHNAPDNKGFIFPNPNNGDFTVQMEKPIDADCILTVYNVLGKAIYTLPLRAINQSKFSISIGNQASGIYLVEIQGKGFQLESKIIIQ
ncbi:MAG: T9SS type A sorting domain-containing protein, partial [Chitinophagales bacterium]|nr:T9SS type A sorting domain-containing protein [Chitinophagales bacterium]